MKLLINSENPKLAWDVVAYLTQREIRLPLELSESVSSCQSLQETVSSWQIAQQRDRNTKLSLQNKRGKLTTNREQEKVYGSDGRAWFDLRLWSLSRSALEQDNEAQIAPDKQVAPVRYWMIVFVNGWMTGQWLEKC